MSSNSSVKSAKDVEVHTCDHDLIFDYLQYDNTSSVHSPQFGAENTSVKWSFVFQYLATILDFDDDDVSIYLMAMNTESAERSYMYGGEVVFYLKSNVQSITLKGTFSFSDLLCEVVLDKDKKFSHRKNLVHSLYLSDEKHVLLSYEGKLKLRCEITFFKLNHVIPLFLSYVQGNTAPFEVNLCHSLEEFGKLYLNENHSDVTICIKFKDTKSKEYPAHKSVLAVRSKVFEAMFKHDMMENKLNRVVVEDIKEEVFLEALRYIYTGHVQKLNTLVYELLPVADRYDLEKLKIICEKTLHEKLSVETALRILILADAHNVDDLKIKAIQMIKNQSDFFKNMDSKAWDDLLSRPQLVKDLLMANNN